LSGGKTDGGAEIREQHCPRLQSLTWSLGAVLESGLHYGPLLNPHFAVGAKDAEGAGIFYEPLAAWDPDGNLIPVLAAEIRISRTSGSLPTGGP
jgi:hypothetical protein